MGVCAAFIIPVGVGAAIYLEEYADKTRWWNRLIEVNIQNLAAVPSIIYGILGLAFIVRGPLDLGFVLAAGVADPGAAGAADGDHRRPRGDPRRAPLDPPGLARARRDQVADDLDAGPSRFDPGDRDRRHPRRLAGARRDGAAARWSARRRSSPSTRAASTRRYTALPVQIFNYLARPQEEFQALAAAGIIVMLVVLLAMNSCRDLATQSLRAEVVGELR